MDKLFIVHFLLSFLWGAGVMLPFFKGHRARIYSIVGALANLVISFLLLASVSDMNATKVLMDLSWITGGGIRYSFCLDGFAGLFMLVNALALLFLVVIYIDQRDKKSSTLYMLLFITLGLISGSFLAGNIFTFFVLSELSIIPFVVIIRVTSPGGSKCFSYHFFYSMIIGQAFFLLSILYLGAQAYKLFGSYDITPEIIRSMMLNHSEIFSVQFFLFFGMCANLFIRGVIFPFHSWYLELHDKASAMSSIISLLLTNLTVYGFVRFVVPSFPLVVGVVGKYIVGFALVSVIYSSIIAFKEKNIRRKIGAFVAGGMGSIIAGVFSCNELAISGAIFQMLSNVISFAGIIFIIDLLRENNKLCEVDEFFNAHKMPLILWVILLCLLLSILGGPFTSGFVGVVLVAWGVFSSNHYFGVIIIGGFVLSSIAVMEVIKKVVINGGDGVAYVKIDGLSWSKTISIVIICSLVIFFGLFPRYLIHIYESSVLRVIGL